MNLDLMNTWSMGQAVIEVRACLPPGWRLSIGGSDGFHITSIKNAEGVSQWESPPAADARIAVLDAFGWLYARTNQPKHPKWGVRPDLTPEAINNKLGFTRPTVITRIPDPGDLDPDEITRVLPKPPR